MPKGVYSRTPEMRIGQYKRKPRGNYRNPIDGFWSKVKKTKSCWLWMAGKDQDGYGMYTPYRKTTRSHRYSYQLKKGQIPKGLTVDHLCRNRSCVNPDHLQVVTNKENILRGEGLAAVHARKTHCIHGHKFDEENTYKRKGGGRLCKACGSNRKKKYAKRQPKKENHSDRLLDL